MKTTIEYGHGITVELDLGDTDRSFREAAAAYRRKHGCPDCNHAKAAHASGNCSVAIDKAGGGSSRCGCSAQKKVRAA